MTRFWRGMANMAQSKGQEVVIVRGEGATVWDRDGNEYLDAIASLWYANIGYGRAKVAEAVTRQLEQLDAFQTFDVYANEPALELAERVAAIAPFEDARVFLTPGGGSDAVESACKITRRYWDAIGRPEKRLICARRHAYHGVNAYGTSLSGIPSNREGFGDLIPDVELVEWNSIEDVRAVFEARASTIAAFIGEPVIGAGGIHPPPDGYWPAIAELCAEHDVLLIADEVISGFGRLGRWFGCEHYGFTPDLVTCAKGLTSGYIPLGGVIANRRVSDPFWEPEDAPMLRHGYTYGGHPVACAAAIANLDILEEERLVERVAELAPTFHRAIDEAFADCPLVGEARGVGLLRAVPIRPDLLASDPTLPLRIAGYARAHGLIVRALGDALQLSPPFVVTEAEIAEIGIRLRAAFDDAIARDFPSADAVRATSR